MTLPDTETRYKQALQRILKAINDQDMSAQNRPGLIEYLAQGALDLLMKSKCEVCFQVIDEGWFCAMHRPLDEAKGAQS